VDQLRDALVSRVRDARSALATARAGGEDYLVVVREGELESLGLLAAEHDIPLPDDDEALGGPAAPAAGSAEPADRIISLVDLEPRRIA